MTVLPIRKYLVLLVAAVSLAGAQPPRIRDINFYGLRKVSTEKILRTLKLHAGDALPGSKGDMEDSLDEISDVVSARVEAVCCEGPDVDLFIGIEERGAPHVTFHSEPVGDVTLPEELANAYREFLSAVQGAAGSRPDAADPRGFQQQFTAFAETHLELLRQALRNAAEPDQRAMAAVIIGYAAKKPDIVNDVQYAVQDPDESVRDNAMRSLQAIAVLAVRQPSLGIRISPTWFIELLNSLVLSDRVRAADALITLTDKGDSAVIDQLRERALPALAEMARWETLRYALPPFLLLGRVAGLSDAETQRRWSNGERQPVIEKALAGPQVRRKKR